MSEQIAGGLRRLVRSFGPALRGVWIARLEGNVRVHLVAAAVVAGLVVAYQLTGSHLAVVVTCVVLVLAMEIMNTAVERLCDFVAELHAIGVDDRIRDIKDLAAGAVLVVATGAAGIGAIVFGPHLG